MPKSGSAARNLHAEDQDHTLGNPSAPVTVIIYGDMECPFTAAFEPIRQELAEGYGEDIRFIFRHFPLSELHPHARQAAEAAECAAAQGKFWEMYGMLLENQDALEGDDLFRYVDELGLDRVKFAYQLGKRRFTGRVERDLETGQELGVESTPTLFINSVKYDGAVEPLPISRRIDHELDRIQREKVIPIRGKRK